MEDRSFPICFVCGDRLGVYEPLVLAGPGGGRQTSLAREAELEHDPGARLAHAACAARVAAEVMA